RRQGGGTTRNASTSSISTWPRAPSTPTPCGLTSKASRNPALEPIRRDAMRVPATRPTLIALVAATSLAGALSLRAQSLGEVGRKEEERRQAVKTPSKVYTNRDLSAPK